MIIDTHAHLNFQSFNEDWEEIIKQTLKEDVWVINVGSQMQTSLKAIEMAQSFPRGVYATVGLHPLHVFDEKLKIEKYRELIRDHKVIALGEVGLDYYRLPKGRGLEEVKERQKKVLQEFINLSEESRLPLILHCREAHKDLLQILEDFDRRSRGFDTRGVIHCYSGDWEQAKKYLNLDFLISFTGIITFSHNYDEVIKKIPLNKLLVETDCPYLSPAPFRGKRNQPSYVKFVAERIAQLKEVSEEEVMEQTTENALKIFKISK